VGGLEARRLEVARLEVGGVMAVKVIECDYAESTLSFLLRLQDDYFGREQSVPYGDGLLQNVMTYPILPSIYYLYCPAMTI
jgi:hypothetical protein